MFPHHYCSRYRAVFYSDYTYSEAKEISQKNDEILTELCKGIKNEKEVDLKLAEKLIFSKSIQLSKKLWFE